MEQDTNMRWPEVTPVIKESPVGTILIVLGIILLVVAAGTFYIYYGMKYSPDHNDALQHRDTSTEELPDSSDNDEVEARGPITEEEKNFILEELSKNGEKEEISSEQHVELKKELDSSSDESLKPITPEERSNLLKALE